MLDPVDSASAAGIVQRANIPVVSYDRLITDADVDYYISFDNERVGRLQGESLLEALDGGAGKRS